MCALTEFGRILLYNILVDGDRDGPPGDDSEDSEDENADAEDQITFKGYKQMILILHSQAVETGKSFLAEILLRLFHGRKVGLHSTLSFDSAKILLKQGEVIVIDDFNNDDIGATLVSRSSKAIWGQAKVTLRNNPIVPHANLVICTNELIRDLKVEGKNKDEIFIKMSVLDLGEEPLGNCSDKEVIFKKVLEKFQKVRKYLPSFFGLMLQAAGKYISKEEFQMYQDITKHERLGNILKNVQNVFNKLRGFCEENSIDPPKSLTELDVSSLTNKSELVFKFKSPDKLAEFLISNDIEMVMTEHGNAEGVAFCDKSLAQYSWHAETMKTMKDGKPVFTRMRTRKLSGSAEGRRAVFMRFEDLDQVTVVKLKNACQEASAETIEMQETVIEPKDIVAKFFEMECELYDKRRKESEETAIKFIFSCSNLNSLACKFCKFVAKSKTGVKNHENKCKKK